MRDLWCVVFIDKTQRDSSPEESFFFFLSSDHHLLHHSVPPRSSWGIIKDSNCNNQVNRRWGKKNLSSDWVRLEFNWQLKNFNTKFQIIFLSITNHYHAINEFNLIITLIQQLEEKVNYLKFPLLVAYLMWLQIASNISLAVVAVRTSKT